MKKFGEYIRFYRKRKGWSMRELALRIQSHKGYISGIENGTCRAPRPPTIKRLAKALGIPPFSLILLAHCEKAHLTVRPTLLQLIKGIVEPILG
jgi:transcriptional regulator with XRE-family HTH domain